MCQVPNGGPGSGKTLLGLVEQETIELCFREQLALVVRMR